MGRWDITAGKQYEKICDVTIFEYVNVFAVLYDDKDEC